MLLYAAEGIILILGDMYGKTFIVGTHARLSEPMQRDVDCGSILIARRLTLPKERVNDESGGHGTDKLLSAERNAVKSS